MAKSSRKEPAFYGSEPFSAFLNGMGPILCGRLWPLDPIPRRWSGASLPDGSWRYRPTGCARVFWALPENTATMHRRKPPDRRWNLGSKLHFLLFRQLWVTNDVHRKSGVSLPFGRTEWTGAARHVCNSGRDVLQKDLRRSAAFSWWLFPHTIADEREINILFEFLKKRCEMNLSTIICSQREPASWSSMILMMGCLPTPSWSVQPNTTRWWLPPNTSLKRTGFCGAHLPLATAPAAAERRRMQEFNIQIAKSYIEI